MTLDENNSPHCSLARFALIAVATILFGPALSFIVMSHFDGAGGGGVTLLEVPEMIFAVWLFQFTIGLLFLIPTCFVALCLAYPIWRFLVDLQLYFGVPPRLSIGLSAIGVTFLVALAADLLMIVVFGFTGKFVIASTFALGPAIIALVFTQLFMVPVK